MSTTTAAPQETPTMRQVGRHYLEQVVSFIYAIQLGPRERRAVLAIADIAMDGARALANHPDARLGSDSAEELECWEMEAVLGSIVALAHLHAENCEEGSRRDLLPDLEAGNYLNSLAKIAEDRWLSGE